METQLPHTMPSRQSGIPQSLERRIYAAVVCLFLFVCCALRSAAAEVSYHNPVVPGDYPDPSVIRVGNDFWATATSSEWGPQFPLLHSRDLVNWDLAGSVFNHRP